MALLVGLVVLAFGSGVWAGWHAMAEKAQNAHDQAVHWVEATDAAHQESLAQVTRQRQIAENEARRAQVEAAAALEQADAESRRRAGLAHLVDSLQTQVTLQAAAPDARDTVIVALTSLNSALTAENTSLRASLAAEVRSSAQFQLALRAADSANGLLRVRVAQLDSVIRAVPPVSRLSTWPSRSLVFVTGLVLGLVVTR